MLIFLGDQSMKKVNRKILVIVSVLLGIAQVGLGQSKVLINFNLLYNKQAATFAQGVFATNDANNTQIETIKFYISKIRLMHNTEIVLRDTNAYLINAQQLKSITLNKPSNTTFNAIEFDLGIDSLLNVSGAMDGDLDPINGMYWTWQSGYINFKIEGSSAICNSKKNQFAFHLGGYSRPFNCLQKVRLPVKNSKIEIALDLFSLLSEINLSEFNHIMSPSLKAVDLSKNLSNLFFIANE